jgi:ABC-type cobalamin/Fe3+-siderophores transport system ATPase subunit
MNTKNTKNSFELTVTQFRFNNQATPFFSDIRLTARPKTLTCIQGKNGSGKSTLFKIIRGMIEPNEIVSGTIRIDDAEHQLAHGGQFAPLIRAVAQNTNLMIADQFTFDENLRLAALPEYPGLKRLPHALPHDLVKQFGIEGSMQACLLSGGQRQILSILMALQKPTRILLLDEPTAALDETNARLVFEFLRQLLASRQITILCIVHDPDLVDLYADRVLSIEQHGGSRKIVITSKTQKEIL